MSETVIDKCEVVTGWTSSDTAKVALPVLNEVSHFIANKNTASLVFNWKVGGLNSYVQKTISPTKSTTGYTEIVLSIMSTAFKYAGTKFNNRDEFKYKIQFNDTMEPVLLPLYNDLTDITIDITGITTIDKIKITALHNEADYLVISQVTLVDDDIPLDIYKSLKSEIESEISTNVTPILSGAVTCITGDTSITISGSRDFLERYAKIKITGGGFTEYHQLFENTEGVYTFTSLYDGESMLHDYTAASVYLELPVEYGKREEEIILPGISIFGFGFSEVLRGGKVDFINDTYRNDRTVSEFKNYAIYEWEINIDVESYHDQLIAIMSQAVRNVISRNLLWINGRKYEIYFKSDPVFIEANAAFNQIPKVQYKMKIEEKERCFARERLPNTVTQNTTVTIE